MRFLDRYFYAPSLMQKILAYLLLPFSLITHLLAYLNSKKPLRSFRIPIISIGNLTIGGSGKTPFLIALASRYENVAVVSRGYGRKSSGVVVVSREGKLLESVENSGDELYLIAQKLKNATVIAAEDREAGIEKAIESGSKILFLDDGFRHRIEKLDILLAPSQPPYYDFCLPSGAYRMPKSFEREADIIVQEERDFKRVVTIKNQTEKMVLVTAIANPSRLDRYLPKNIAGKEYFPDHHFFKKEELESILRRYEATSLLVTEKDSVKLETFNIPLSIMQLQIDIDDSVLKKIELNM